MSIIAAQNLSKHYGRGAARFAALDRVDLEVAAGERVALVGRSGSGKTTLLNLVAGLDHPTGGTLQVAGEDMGRLTASRMAAFRLARVGMIFQSFQLLPQRTALQNVELPLILAGAAKRTRRETARECLARVGLAERMHHRPFQLSGGEQQRVAIARSLVNRPSLLLADEPTGNLDSHSAERVALLLLEIIEETQAALVLVTHDREFAQRCASRIVSLADGRIESTGATEA